MKKLLIAVVIFVGVLLAQPSQAASYSFWASAGSGSYGGYYAPYTYSYYAPYWSTGGYLGGSQIAYYQFMSGSGSYSPTRFRTNAVRVVGAGDNRPAVVVSTGSGVNTSDNSGFVPVTGSCASGVYQYNVCVIR